MSEIRFYHVEHQTLDQVLPQLVTKALQNNHRIVIHTANDNAAESLNTHLWTFNPNSFIPHGTKKDGHETDQPVWVTATEENPNEADVLILTAGQDNNALESYHLVCDMIDGRNEDAVTAARARWKAYKDAGHTVTYWQQGQNGGWEKKA